MSLRFEAWTEPWNTGGFARKIAKLPVMPGTGTGDVRLFSTGGSGAAEIALAGFNRIDEVVSADTGSLIRVYDGTTIVAEWLPQRTPKSLVGAAKTAPLTGNNLVSVFDQVVNYAREYPSPVAENQDTIWAGRNILTDGGVEEAAENPETYEIILDGAGSGSFTLTVNGATTSSLQWDASDTTVENALQGIGTPTILDVYVVETSDGWTIEFVSPPVPNAIMTWTPSLSGGGGDHELKRTSIGRVDLPAHWTTSQFADKSSNPHIHGSYASVGGFLLVGPALPINGPVRTGNSSLRVNGLTRYSGGQQIVDVEPGFRYQATAWVRTGDATEVFKLVMRDIYEVEIGHTQALISAADTYTEYNLDFTVPDNRDKIIFRIAQVVDHNPAPFYVDDMSLLEGAPAATPGVIMIAILDDIVVDHAGDPRGALLTWVDYSSFDATDDSNGNPWSDSIPFTAFYGETLGQILDKLVNLGFEWELVPKTVPSGGLTHDFHLYNSGGRDDTPSTAITIRQGVLGGEVIDRIPSFTALLAQGSGVFYEEESAAASDFGRFEKFLPARDIGTVAALNLLTDTAFTEEANNRRAAQFNIVETLHHPRPGINYIPGDTIPMQAPPALPRGLRRVVAFDYANTKAATYSVTGSTIYKGEAAAYELVRRMWRKFEPPPIARRSGKSDLQDVGAGPGTVTILVAANDSLGSTQGATSFLCTGINDHLVIQRALDELPVAGGRVLLSEGTFFVEATVDLPGSNVILEGAGAVWSAATGTGGITATSGGKHIITGIRFTNTTQAASTQFGFIRCNSQVLVTHNWFTDMTVHAVLGSETTLDFGRYIITNNWFENITLSRPPNGIQILALFNDSGAGSRAQDAIFANNMIKNVDTVPQSGHSFALVTADPSQGRVQSFGNQAEDVGSLQFDDDTAIAFHNVIDGVHIPGDHAGISAPGIDSTAIHDNVAGEIDAIAEVAPVDGDWLIIEDTSDADNKKKVDVAAFLAGALKPGVTVFSKGDDLAQLVDGNAHRFYFPFAVTLLGVRASVSTNGAPTGSSVVVDVHKNGITVFTTQGNRPEIVAAGVVSSNEVPDVTAVAADDYLTVNIDEIGSTLPGSNLTVVIEWEE